jgi:hypothetical protein
MKKLIALVAAFLFVASSGTASVAAEDRYDPNLTVFEPGKVLIQVGEEDVVNSISWMHTTLGNDPGITSQERQAAQKECASMKDPNCDISKDSRLRIAAQSILGFCAESKTNVCVESLELAKADGEFVAARYIKAGSPAYRLEADEISGLLEGSGPLIFESAGQKYAVVFKASQSYSNNAPKFSIGGFSANVIPVRDEVNSIYANWKSASTCVYIVDSGCGIAQNFETGTKVRVKFNIPKSIGGWFRGRIKDPVIAISSLDAKTNSVIITAEPVTVPRLAVVRDPKLMTGKELDLYNISGGWGIPSGSTKAATASHPMAFDYVDLYRPIVSDLASGVQTMWMLNTTQGGNGSSCLTDTSKVLGIVTTNSMVYSGSSPAFENGYLNYKVAGMHFMPDGKTEVLGTYDLVMRSETARCLYGFSKAPVSATVSVAGGSESVATTVVSEKDGWLKMAAYGFTFSQKTIQIKMTQKTVAKKSTITCVKGKVTKKVTAVAPKCPTGYKKK